MYVSVTPIKSDIGVVIEGLSGRRLADPRVAEQCRVALDKYGVVVCREANIEDSDLVALTKILGEVSTDPATGEAGHPEVSIIGVDPSKSRFAPYRTATFVWHIDGVTDAVPRKAILLSAQEVADEGGQTEFANTYAAYEALPESAKTKLINLRVLHTARKALEDALRFADAELLSNRNLWDTETAVFGLGVRGGELTCIREHRTRVQPLVWSRRNGRKSLVIGATATEVVDWPADEGRALLDRLLGWSTQPKFVLRHQWRRGDLVIWDNTGMLHRAFPYKATSGRLMHRTTLVGEEAIS